MSSTTPARPEYVTPITYSQRIRKYIPVRAGMVTGGPTGLAFVYCFRTRRSFRWWVWHVPPEIVEQVSR